MSTGRPPGLYILSTHPYRGPGAAGPVTGGSRGFCGGPADPSVRAAKVQHEARRRSGTWRANEQHRLHQLHERSQTAPIATPVRQPYTWREQTEISIDTGATSGAAAVILKRRRAAACVNKDAPEDKRRGTAGGEQSTQHTRERRVDSQLIFTTNTHRLYVDRITFWRWWPRTGDG